MHQIRPAFTIALALAVGVLSQACSSAPSIDGRDEVGQSTDALVVVCPKTITCCVSASLAPLPWDLTHPLEVQLSAWGCSKPRLYQPNQATNAWWYWSQCVDTGNRVETYLATHPEAVAAPYLAVTSTTLDKACVATPPAGSIDVLWDPTCPTCRVAN